jgi:hypothetical protein
MAINFLSNQSVAGELTVSTIPQIGSDTDKFLMSDSGVIKYVTGVNLRSYIGAGTSSTDNYVGNASWSSSTGVISLARTGGLSTLTVDIDGRYLLDTSDTFTGALTINGDIRGNSQELILNAGESYNFATSQTAEWVYVNAEQGLEINSSPDNWASGWAGRNITRLGKADGSSAFSGALTWSGGGSVESNTAYDNSITALAVSGSTTLTLTATQQDSGTLTASWTPTYVAPTAPAAPGSIVATIVGETIEIQFNQSSTSTIGYYQVWASDDGGDYGLIAQITPADFSATMTVVDTTFETGGTMSYRVFAVKGGLYSTAGTVSKTYTVSALSVTNMTVVNLNTAYYIQYEKPISRFIDHIEIWMDSTTTQAALLRANAILVYSGQNPSYMRNVNASSNFHQFWVEITTS